MIAASTDVFAQQIAPPVSGEMLLQDSRAGSERAGTEQALQDSRAGSERAGTEQAQQIAPPVSGEMLLQDSRAGAEQALQDSRAGTERAEELEYEHLFDESLSLDESLAFETRTDTALQIAPLFFEAPLLVPEQFDPDAPRYVESVSREELQRSGVTSLDDAIARLTNAPRAGSAGDQAPLIIDGLDATWVTILVDGIPWSRPTNTRIGPVQDLRTIPIDPSRVERIEIYRGVGPSASCDASGIIINIVTREGAPEHRFGATIDTGFTADGFSSGGGRGTLELALSDHVALQANGSWRRLREIDVNDDGNFDRPRLDTDDANLALVIAPENNARWHLRVGTWGFRNRAIGNPASPLEDRTVSRGYRGGISYESDRREETRYTARIDLQHLNHRFFKYVRNSGFERTISDTRSLLIQGTARAELERGDHVYGIEPCFRLDNVSRDGAAGALPTIYEGQGCLAADAQLELGDALNLDLRALGGYHSALGPRWLASAALAYNPLDELGLRFSVDASQRVPTAEERFLAFDHSELGYAVVGNEDLEVEELLSFRLGFTWLSDDQRVALSASSFAHLQWERIDTVLLEPASPPEIPVATFTYENRGDATSAGLDLQARFTDLPGGLFVHGGYNWLPIAYDRTLEQRIDLRSRHSGRIEVGGNWLDGDLSAWVNTGIQSPLSWSQTGAPPRGDITTLIEIGASWAPVDGLRAVFRASNLIDQTQPTWGPMPGREFLFTLQMDVP